LPLPAGFDEVHTMHRRIMAVEAAHLHRDLFAKRREQYGAQITTLLNEGLAIETSDYVAAIEHQSRFRHAVHDSLQEVEAILLPATCDTAPRDLSTTGDPVFNSPWSYAGVPAVSIPCALADSGLPVAMQLIGPALGEAQTLAAAAWCEGVFDFSATPSLA
jgi:aspartyl-tRNA(Asn)/glutamyl-tRNA(Gln) amidotransferase subunit A